MIFCNSNVLEVSDVAPFAVVAWNHKTYWICLRNNHIQNSAACQRNDEMQWAS